MNETKELGKRILILRTDHLGDAILTTPLIRSLAKAGNTVEFIVHDAYLDLFSNNPYLTSCHGLESICSEFPRNWRRLASWIRERNYDVLIVPYGQPKQLLFASLFSGVRWRMAAHSQFWGNITLHSCPRLGLRYGITPYPEAILVFADLLGAPRDGIETDLNIPEENVFHVKRSLEARGGGARWIGIHPGSGGSACNFPSSVYKQILNKLMEVTDCKFVVTGTVSEQHLVESWGPLVQSPRVWNTMGKLQLRDAAALIQQLDLLICPPTATLHMAGAFRTPTLSPFCPVPCMRPEVWGPKTGQARFLMPAREQCPFSPVNTKTCNFTGKLFVDQMIDSALQILSETAQRS